MSFIANLEKINWLIGVTEEIKKPLQLQELWVISFSLIIDQVSLFSKYFAQVIRLRLLLGRGRQRNPTSYNRAVAHPDCLALMLRLQLHYLFSVCHCQDRHWY